jgi:hypothetical protein
MFWIKRGLPLAALASYGRDLGPVLLCAMRLYRQFAMCYLAQDPPNHTTEVFRILVWTGSFPAKLMILLAKKFLELGSFPVDVQPGAPIASMSPRLISWISATE